MSVTLRIALVAALVGAAASAEASQVQDIHGNVGFDTAAECDAAVNAGTVKFYRSFTTKPPLRRAGEVSVKAIPLSALNASYAMGACDIGVGRKAGRDGVAQPLIGKFVPYSPDFMVNVYYNRKGEAVRVMMKQCDNWFSDKFPRPVAVASAPIAAKSASPAAVAPAVETPEVKPAAPAAVNTPVKAAAAATKVSPAVWGAIGAVAVGIAIIASDNDANEGSNSPNTTTVTSTK